MNTQFNKKSLKNENKAVLKRNKKAVLPLLGLLLSPIMLVIMGILLLLIIVSIFGFTYFLTINAFTLAGVFLIVIGGIGALMRFNPQIAFTFIGIGLAILFLPLLFKGLTGITLAALMP